MIIKSVARVIRAIRQEKGIKQDDFLFDLGIHVARIEMGIHDISMTTFLSICCKMQIPVVDFIERLSVDLQGTEIPSSIFIPQKESTSTLINAVNYEKPITQ